ncbi:LysR family transcriptional regulator [Endozoicomonas sp. OPT23]|uniref:LysR family transcriptional regulator n=1 Tax=Endozoicomonas sp. OPT23 TaxID=2072845 RepID=UPI001E2F7C54|nr:LysR family transcriptional regulator [Endozoicomonas sp. OPT23]
MTQYSMKHLLTFCTVVECGGFASAQAALGMSQPAISTHIRDLEIRLGFQLCHRGRSGFSLTEKGELAYDKCRLVLNNISDFEAELGELRNNLTGTLRIGLIDNTITNQAFPLHQAVETFFSRKNDVSIKLEILPPEALEQQLISGHIQIGIGPFQRRDSILSYELLHKEEHRFYCGKQHPLFSLSEHEINWQTLQQHRVSSRAYMQNPDLPGIKNTAYVSNMEAQAMLIISGQFMGFLPVHYAQSWVDSGEMKAIDHLNLSHYSSFYLAMRDSPSIRNIVSVFLEDIKTTLPALDTRERLEPVL